MERLAMYRKILKEVLRQQAEVMSHSPQSEIETELTFDEERDHYLLLRLGWTPEGRLFVPTLYARLHNGKIWIENDWTEEGLATGLLAACRRSPFRGLQVLLRAVFRGRNGMFQPQMATLKVENAERCPYSDRLLEQGIPAEDVVLAFHPPEMRVHTEFAVA